MRRVYLDNNATTPVEPTVLEAMLPFFCTDFGNASSIHSYGQRCRGAVETARSQVAALLGAKPGEIIFTSGGTEGDNLAIFGVACAVPGEKKHIITTRVEHNAVINVCQELQRRGVEVTFVPVSREGVVDPEEIRRALRPETVLISVMYANNELGTVQPLEEIGRIAAEADVYFHTDAVQAAGKIPIDVEKLGVDLCAISGHKLNAPKGVGALYVRPGTHVQPHTFGGRHERGRRPGTENVPGIVGLGKACELAQKWVTGDGPRVAALRDRLQDTLLALVPETRPNGSRAPRTPNTANITFFHIEGESLVIALDMRGLACSTGAACSSGAVEPSHVLTAIGMPPEEARASIRFSLGHNTTADDVDFALSVIPGAVEKLRELSPAWKKAVVVR